jgi:hypothetical protein
MGFDPVSYLLGKQAGGGGGGGVTVEPLSVTENGTYTAPTGKAYSPVSVDVPLTVGIVVAVTTLTSMMARREMSPPIAKMTVHNTNSSASNAQSAFMSLLGVDEIVFTVDNGVSNLASCFDNCHATHITLHADTSACTSVKGAFNGQSTSTYRTVVDGDPIDLSSATQVQDTVGYTITEIRFVPGTCKISWKNSGCANITDATLVSMANALDGTVSGQTMTIHATPKARCQTLMGTVADGVFTADASGTVTLADFITNTKGWTLA